MPVSVACLSSLVLGVFILNLLLKLLANPASLITSPTSEKAMEVVDKSSTRSIAIFSIVLVVIQFSLPNSPDTPLSHWQSLAISILTLSAGFLTVSFILELWGSVINYFFNLQITALRYAGLLLFSGLYFLLEAKNISGTSPSILGIFVLLAWVLWIIHELDYILKAEREEWRNSKYKSRRECLIDIFKTVLPSMG